MLVTQDDAYAAFLAVTVMPPGEAAMSKHAKGLVAYEPIAKAIRETAGRFCREDLDQGPRRDYLEEFQVGVLVELIHRSKTTSLEDVVCLAEGPLRRKIESQFGRQKRRHGIRKSRRGKAHPSDPPEQGRELTQEEKDHELAAKIRNPITLHCDWAIEGDSGFAIVMRPRRRGGT